VNSPATLELTDTAVLDRELPLDDEELLEDELLVEEISIDGMCGVY